MTTQISPTPKLAFWDANGNPAVGYKLFTYAAGTTDTEQTTYTDSGGGTPNTNPIVLDARGEARVWLTPGLGYKYVFANPDDSDPPTSPIWTVDQVFGAVSSENSGGFITVSELAAPDGGQLIGFQQPEAGAVATTFLELGQEEISAYAFMTDGQKIAVRNRTPTDVTTAMTNALAAVCAEKRELKLPYGLYNIDGDLVIPSSQGWRLKGLGAYGASIIQNANNTPIFHFTSQDTHSWKISDLYLGYASQQNSGQTKAIVFYFDAAGGNGIYQWKVLDCNADFGYSMFSNNLATQSIAYGFLIDGCWCLPNMVGSFATFLPVAPQGQPRMTFGTNYVRAAKLTQPVISASACDTFVIQNLEINTLTDQSALQLLGGCAANIIAMRSEGEIRTSTSSGMSVIVSSDSATKIGVLSHSVANLNLGSGNQLYMTGILGSGGSVRIGTFSCSTPGGNTSGTILLSRDTAKNQSFGLDDIFGGTLPTPYFLANNGGTTGSLFASIASYQNQAMSFDPGDADVTLVLGDATNQYSNTTLTAGRVYTLPVVATTHEGLTVGNAPNGYRFDFTRGPNAAGAFNRLVKDSGGSTIATLAAASSHASVAWNPVDGWAQVE